MRKTNFLFAICLFMSLYACNNNVGENSTDPTVDSTATTDVAPEEAPAPAPDATTMEGFWAMYQDAVAKKDIAKMKSLTNMGEVGEEFYDDMFFTIYAPVVTASAADKIQPSEVHGEGTFELRVEETPENPSSDEEGEGTSVSLYIGKKADGKLQIIGAMAAG